MNNKISIYLITDNYSNATQNESGYLIKNLVYTKCNIVMSRPSEQMFHRFLPDIDLSLHGDDYAYFRGLQDNKSGRSKIAIKLIVENYLGSSETKTFKGLVSRKTSKWDFDKKKVTLDIEWQDGYTTILNNLDNEYNILKLGVPSRPIQIYIQPIVQIYQQGSTIVDNFIGGERFETQGDDTISESDLLDKYNFAKTTKTLDYEFSAVDRNKINAIAKAEGFEVGENGTYPQICGPYKYFEIQPQYFDSMGTINSYPVGTISGYNMSFIPVLRRDGSYDATLDWLDNNELYDSKVRYLSNDQVVENAEIYADEGTIYWRKSGIFEHDEETGEPTTLKYTLGIIAIVESTTGNVVAYAYDPNTLNANSKPVLYAFNSATDSTKFCFAGKTKKKSVEYSAQLIKTQSNATFVRIIFRDSDNTYGYALEKNETFNPNPKMYNRAIPYGVDLFNNTSTSSRFWEQIHLNMSTAYNENDSDGANEYGCYTDQYGKNKYYEPPFDFVKNATTACWNPIQRNLWTNVSYWVRFGDSFANDYRSDFWSGTVMSRLTTSYRLKDAYRLDDIIRTLMKKVNESVEDPDDYIWVPEMPISPVDVSTGEKYVTFSRFFEIVNNNTNEFLGVFGNSFPYFVPASNVIAGEYDLAAQNWKLSLKQVLGWAKTMFNCYFRLNDIMGNGKFMVFEMENEVFFKQGYSYGRDSSGFITDLTNTAIKDACNLQYVFIGQNSLSNAIDYIPSRYEFGSGGDGGKIFSDFAVDMGVVDYDTNECKAINDYIISDKCSVSKVSPSNLYTDIDRINAMPDNFSKDATVLIMGNIARQCRVQNTYYYDAKNGRRWLRVSNFYASWIALSRCHTNYTHSFDCTEEEFNVSGASDCQILPYIDCINNGKLTTAEMTQSAIENLNASPYGGTMIGRTGNVDLDFILDINSILDDEITVFTHDNLYAFKINVNGIPVKGITESAEINLLTGRSKFKVKTKPVM